jgi:hypothetical protein
MSEPTMVERLARRWNERLTQDFEIPVVQPMPGWYANDARWWLRAIAEELAITAHDVGSLRMAADLARDTQSARWYRDLADRIEVLLADELHER